ncbi:MAG: ATP-binding protein [Deferribacteraceae bacterium]|jgi:AAA15 family ATPase/GTPase|nr:ATP-binding protein [Deferribacteraceae bacterium]
MLLTFRIKNFKSIVDTAIDMRIDGGAASCLGLYGANASGKSNILAALAIFRDIVANRAIDERYFPNKIQEGAYSSFELNFTIGKDNYIYRLSYNDLNIIEEGLICNGYRLLKTLASNERGYETDFWTIANEAYPVEKLGSIFKVECQEGFFQRAPFLSVLGKNYANLNAQVTAAFNYLVKHIIIYQYSATNAINKLQDVSEIIKKLDISINSMAVEHGNIYTYHTAADGREVRFKFDEESLGTQIMTHMLGAILVALETGSIVLIDELDMSLHPLLLKEIVRLFKDIDYNANGAQLIFTAHNTNILEEGLIDAAELGIVTKIQQDGTTLARAIDYDKIENSEELQKAYLDGDFGGIPFPYI